MADSQRVLPRAAFRSAIRSRNADVDGFVRALYRARGWTIKEDGDGFVAARDGDRRRIVVRRTAAVPFVSSGPPVEDADVVVLVGEGGRTIREAAAEAGARIVDEHTLYRRALYGIPRERADELCREYLGRSATAPVEGGVRDRLRGTDRTRLASAVVVASVVALVVGMQFVYPAIPAWGTNPGLVPDPGFGSGGAAASAGGPGGGTAGAGGVTPVEIPDRGASSAQVVDLPPDVAVRSGDWPTFRGGPSRVGAAPRASGPGTPDTVRTYDRGVGSVSSPAVASGWLYIGGFRGTLYALDAETMTTNWSRSLSQWVTYSPTVANDTVFVGGQDGRLYAVDAATGDRRWTTRLSSRIIRSSPAVYRGTVYVGSNDGIHAVRAETGEVIWNGTGVDPVFSSPAVWNGTLYVADFGGTVHALNASTGAERWSRTLDARISATPAVENGTIYLGDKRGQFYALSTATGDTRWTRQVGSAFQSSPAVYRGRIYVGNDDRRVYALNATTGAGVWNTSIGEVTWDQGEARPDSGIASSPTVANGTIYVGSNGGGVYALAADDGTVRWRVSTGGDVTASAAVVDGTVYIGNLAGEVYAIRGEPGDPSSASDGRSSDGE